MKHSEASGLPRVQRALTVLLCAALAAYFIFLLYTAFHYHYPQELREVMNAKTAYDLAHGTNPFSTSWLTENQAPPVYHCLPFLNCLTGALLIALTGLPAMLAMYLQTILHSALALLLLFRILRQLTGSALYAATGAFLGFYCLYRWSYVPITSDITGLLLIVLLFFCVTHKTLRAQSFWCALVSVLIFYTKPHYLVVAVSLFFYFLLLDKKRALSYLCFCLGLGALSLAAVQHFFPLAFTETIALYMLGSSLGGDLSIRYFFMQAAVIGMAFFPLLALLAVLLGKRAAACARRKIQLRRSCAATHCEGAHEDAACAQENAKGAHEDAAFFFVKIAQGKGVFPAIAPRPEAYFLLTVCIAMAGLLYVGQNVGAYLSYFLHMLCPALIVLGFSIFAAWERRSASGHTAVLLGLVWVGGIACFPLLRKMIVLYPFLQTLTLPVLLLCLAAAALLVCAGYWRKQPQGVGIALCLCATLFVVVTRQFPHPSAKDYYTSHAEAAQWDAAYALLETHQSDNMYLAPHLTAYALERDLYAYDYGNNDLLNGSPPAWENSRVLQQMFPYVDDMYLAYERYWREMVHMVRDRQYSVIAVTDWVPVIAHGGLNDAFMQTLSQEYILADEMILQASLQPIPTQFYIPRT